MPATKILWGQITIVMLVVLLTTWSATEGVAWRLAFQPELGAPWFRVVRRARQRSTADMLALFVRFWLTITPPLPEEAQSAAQIKGRERFDGFIQTLERQLQKGRSVLREIPDDLGGDGT